MTSKRGPLLTARQLASVVVAVVAAIAASVTLAIAVPPAARAASPDIPVQAYLYALVRGDASAALKAGHITPGAGDKLLTADAYAKASDRITSFSITSMRTSGGTGTVDARIHQGSTSYDVQFPVTRESGFPGLAPWDLTPQQLPQLAITVTGPKTPVSVAGVTLAALNGTTTQSVFPGTYAVAANSGSFYSAPPHTVSVALGRAGGSASFALALTAQGKAQLEASAQSWLNTCAASSELAPSGCPFRAVATPGITYSAGHWEVTSAPALQVGSWSSSAGGWQVTTSAPGSVTFTAHATEGNLSGTASTGPQEFAIIGSAVASGSGVSFVPAPGYASQGGSLA